MSHYPEWIVCFELILYQVYLVLPLAIAKAGVPLSNVSEGLGVGWKI